MKDYTIGLAVFCILWVAGPLSAQAPYVRLESNNIRAGFHANGSLFLDSLHQPQFEVPLNGGVSTIFGSGLWVGGKTLSGDLMVAAQSNDPTKQDFWPGPLDAAGNIDSATSDAWNKIWMLHRPDVDSFLLDWADGNLDDPIPASVQQWPARNNPFNTLVGNREAAPFVDINDDGIYDPSVGDYPVMKGDIMLWWVFNDKRPERTSTGGNPLGMEIHCQAFIFTDPLDTVLYHTVFVNYRLINKSGESLDSLYIGQWTDLDIGCSLDDFVASDPGNHTFLAYNGHAIDNACAPNYGTNSPLQTITFLNHDLSKFIAYENDLTVRGKPESPAHYYQYLQGRWKDNSRLTCNGNGYGGTQDCAYLYPDNPVDQFGWSECGESNIEGERAGIGVTGPFHLPEGMSIELELAFAAHFYPGGYVACPDLTPVQENVQYIRNTVVGCVGSDCIWPGDADGNGVADAWDILPLGIEYGQTGPGRISTSIEWLPRFGLDWEDTLANGKNYKIADCDGNGIVNRLDKQAILVNYASIHGKRKTAKGREDDPVMYLEIPEDSTLTGAGLEVGIYLGTDDEPVQQAYGIAFTVNYDPSLIDSGSVVADFSPGWFGKPSQIMTIEQDRYGDGAIDLGITRVDQLDTSGFGLLINLNIVIIDNIDGKPIQQLDMSITDVKLITSQESVIPVNTLPDSVYILTGMANTKMEPFRVDVFPNPAAGTLNIQSYSAALEAITLLNTLGRQVGAPYQVTGHRTQIDVRSVPNGIYFVDIRSAKGRLVKKFIIQQ